jgi:hypothetical protein
LAQTISEDLADLYENSERSDSERRGFAELQRQQPCRLNAVSNKKGRDVRMCTVRHCNCIGEKIVFQEIK